MHHTTLDYVMVFYTILAGGLFLSPLGFLAFERWQTRSWMRKTRILREEVEPETQPEMPMFNEMGDTLH